MLRQALSMGANVHSRDPEARNQTCLHTACQFTNGHADVIRELLARGADVNAVNDFNK